MRIEQNRVRRSAEKAARSRAREALIEALDRLGSQLATPDEAIDFVRLAGQAFAPSTAARKLTIALWRFVSTGGNR